MSPFLTHSLTGPSGHLSPCKGERSRSCNIGVNLAAGAPLPLAGGEVARRAGEGVPYARTAERGAAP